MDPVLILFAIEAGVRLGRELNDVLVDATHERPLVLPLGDLHAHVGAVNAIEFFDRPENVHLVEAGGPYEGFSREELARAHATLAVLDERLGGRGDTLSEAGALVARVHRFAQLERSHRANPPLQRLLGTLVEVGIDWFAAHPEALHPGSGSRKVVTAFVTRLDGIEFSEGGRDAIVARVLVASLQALEDDVALLDDDQRLQALLGGVTRAWIAEIEAADGLAERLRREGVLARIGRSALRGGVTAFSEHAELFLPGNAAAARWVESALRQTLSGLRDHEDLFTAEAVEQLFAAALRAVGENVERFADEEILQELIAETTRVLAERAVAGILSRETASSILAAGLEVTAENAETLIHPHAPRRQLLTASVAALASGLSDELAGGGAFRGLFSHSQRIALFTLVYEEVARHPELLLGDDAGSPGGSALAQVVGSVGAAIGEDPAQGVTGEGALELVQLALHVGVRNADTLLDLASEEPRSNLLFRVLRELVLGAREAGDPRGLLSRPVFVEMVKRALPVASADPGRLLESESPIVQETVAAALTLARGALARRINGENLPGLVERLLVDVLRGELALDEAGRVHARATAILDAA